MTCDCRRGESELKYGIITNNCKETGQDINCKPWGKGRDVQVLDITPPPPTSKDELMQADEYACISPIYQRL